MSGLGRARGGCRPLTTVLTALLLTAGCGADPGGGSAQGGANGDYPAQRISFIVPYAPGGTTDPLGRLYASRMEGCLKGQVVVENVPGAAGSVGTERILSAKPDGYTFGLTTGSALLVAPRTTKGLSYQDASDWSVISKVSEAPYVLVVKADAPWQTFEELLKAAKAKPGDITVSTPGAFNPGDLVLEQLNSEAGDVFRATPFSGGGGEALAAVLGGQVKANVAGLATAKGQLDAGKLRALAVFDDAPVTIAGKVVPAITALKYNATLAADFFIVAPPGIPEGVQGKLSECSTTVIESPEMKKFVEETAAIHTPLGAEEASANLQSQVSVYDDVFAFLKERGRLDRG